MLRLKIITFLLGSTFFVNLAFPQKTTIPADSVIHNTYIQLDDTTLTYDVFQQGYYGFMELKEEDMLKKNLLTIIDYSRSANEDRMWIIDMDSVEVVHRTLVAHGRNSGQEYAQKFSNIPNSNMSSLGFFLTQETYYGKHGLSLFLQGLEPGINDKARDRYIVIHGADYVSPDFIRRYGRLGRSLGCPALPTEVSKPIIKLISHGSCIYIFAEDDQYRKRSSFLN